MAFPVVPASSSDGHTLSSYAPQSFGNELSSFQHQTTRLLPQRRQPSNQDWEMLKDDIRQLYLVENKTLKEVVKRLCAKHGFRPTEKQLTKRLEQWKFRKNKSRKRNESLSKRIIETHHVRRFEPTDIPTTKIKKRGLCESNAEMDVELQHVEDGFEQNQIPDICRTKHPRQPGIQDTSTVLGTICKTPPMPTKDSGSTITELAHQLSRLNISFPDDMSLFEKPSDDDTPKEYLTNEDIKELAIFGCSRIEEAPHIFTSTISLAYPQRYGKRNGPFKLQGHDVDFSSAALVPSLSGELYPFPYLEVSDRLALSSSPKVDEIRRTISDYLAKFERLSLLSFPETHPAMIHIMGELGENYCSLDKGRESEAWCRRELSARLLSGESPVSIKILKVELSIVEALRLQRRYQEARMLQKEVHQKIVNNEVANVNDDLFCLSLANLGWILCDQNYLNDAEACFRNLFQIRLNSLGPWNKVTISAMRYLCVIFEEKERYENEAFLTTTLQICNEVLGMSQTLTLDGLDDLAMMKNNMGQFQESDTIYRSLIQRAELAFGEEHPAFLTFAHNFSRNLLKQDQLEEGEKIARRTIDMFAKVQGQDHPDTLGTISILGEILRKKGRYEEAAKWYEKSTRGHSFILGSDNFKSIADCNGLAECYGVLGRFEDAVQLLRRFTKEVETQVASRKEPCWGDEGLPKIQKWIEWFKEDMEYYQEMLHAQVITEVDEELFTSTSDASSFNEGGSSGTEDIFDKGGDGTNT